MKIDILCVGKLKEPYLVMAQSEYAKRLSRYCKLSIIELPDEKTPAQASKQQEAQIKNKEGERILAKLSPNAYVVVLDLFGKMLSSEEFAQFIYNLGMGRNISQNENRSLKCTSHITFIIGGSLGLSEGVLKRANFSLSFSKLTFPHQLFRILLLEQIYRAFKINANEPYHK